MKTSILIFAIVLGFASAQVTQLELLQAWNYARSNPQKVASRIEANFINKGVKGVFNDEQCYTEAVTFLKSQKAITTLTEDAGIDLASHSHSSDLLKQGKKELSHTGSDKSTPESRLKKFGRFFGKYNLFELVFYKRQDTPISANDIIDTLITDCKMKSRLNRKFIFSTEVIHFGAGVAYKKGRTYATLMGTKGFTKKAITNKQLEKARVEGNAEYKGKGVSHSQARWRDTKEFKKGKKQIIKMITPGPIDDSTGPLGDLKDDKSAKCPTYVNSKQLEKKVIRKWTVTSKKCTRGKGDFTRTDNLARYAPFAKSKKCYHRLAYCSTLGQVWVFDREYKTMDEVDAREAAKPVKSVLGTLKNDKSVDCPQWVNGNLRKRIVQDWYRNGGKCSVGHHGFSKKGFRAHKAVSVDKRCYQRNEFCDKNGHVWVKDSEYFTFAEYQARKL